MKITKLTKICVTCPTQYEGETDDGKYVYIRYRFGNFKMEVNHEVIFTTSIGNGLGGCIELDKIKELTKHLDIEWPPIVNEEYGGRNEEYVGSYEKGKEML